MRYPLPMIKNKKNQFELVAWAKNRYVCGIDEAGRGSLFGPLVVAAAILPLNTKCSLLKDSKIMTKLQREEAFEWIQKNCFFSSIIVDHATIDHKNVYQATRSAMIQAFVQLTHTIPFHESEISHLITDAVPIALPVTYNHADLILEHPTHAESLSQSVAAASIIAKVTRDNLMDRFAKIFPAFELEHHKGYGTSLHIEKIKAHGASVIHRTSFLSNFTRQDEHDQQQTIC